MPVFNLDDRVYCGRNGKWGIVIESEDDNGKCLVMYGNDNLPYHVENASDLVLQIIKYPIFQLDQRVYNSDLKINGIIREIKDLDDYGLFGYRVLYDDNRYGVVNGVDVLCLVSI